jgi:hypothetical protein
MADNIIRFPGYLRTEDRTGVWKDGELHKSLQKNGPRTFGAGPRADLSLDAEAPRPCQLLRGRPGK